MWRDDRCPSGVATCVADPVVDLFIHLQTEAITHASYLSEETRRGGFDEQGVSLVNGRRRCHRIRFLTSCSHGGAARLGSDTELSTVGRVVCLLSEIS